MNVDAATIIALLSASGVGVGISQAITALINRKKTGVDVTAVMGAAAAEMLETQRKEYAHVTAELAKTRAEFTQLGAEFRQVEDKLDHVLDVVAAEKKWVRARNLNDAPVLVLLREEGA